MKKYLSVIAVMLLVLQLFMGGCGKLEGSPMPETTPEATPEATPQPSPTPGPTPAFYAFSTRVVEGGYHAQEVAPVFISSMEELKDFVSREMENYEAARKEDLLFDQQYSNKGVASFSDNMLKYYYKDYFKWRDLFVVSLKGVTSFGYRMKNISRVGKAVTVDMQHHFGGEDEVEWWHYVLIESEKCVKPGDVVNFNIVKY
nr:hypothetical protein [bacterium]